jgi:diacylglycerol kinase family enzyme
MANSDIGLLVIPAGTANDLASELSDPKDIEKIIQCIRVNSKKKIDLININGTYMATNGGIGLAGMVASKINDLRKDYPLFKNVMRFSGNKIYSLFLGFEIIGHTLKYYNLKLKSPDFNDQVEAVAILVNNQSTLAGSFVVAPNTNNSDGKFNVSIFTHPTKQDLVKALLELSRGQVPQEDPYYTSFETTHLEIESLSPDQNISFFGDGEVFPSTNRWDISIEKQALTVYAVDPSKDLVDWVEEVTLT